MMNSMLSRLHQVRNLRIWVKMLIIGLLSVAIPIIIIGFISVYQSIESTAQLQEKSAAEIAEDIADALDIAMTEQISAARNISFSNSVISAAEKVARDGEAKSQEQIRLAQKELSKIKDASGDRYSSVLLVGKNETAFASSDNGKMRGLNLKGRDFLAKAKSGVSTVGSVVVSRATGKLVCTAAVPIYKGGEIVGAVVSAVHLEAVTRIFDQMRIGRSEYPYVVDKDGYYVVHPVRDNILKTNISTIKGMETIWDLVKQSKKGSVEYEVEGARKFACVSPVAVTGWTVVRAVPMSEIYGPARRTTMMIAIAGLLSLLAAAFAFYVFSSSLAGPMNKVVEAAQRISVGDLSMEVIPDGRRDEIGDLSEAFVKMTAALKERASLAERIATGDLTADVVKLSGDDLLGESLSAMIEQLRNQTQAIVNGVNVLAASSSEIMASATQLTSGASETAVAVSETSATVEEVKQTAEMASKKAKQVAELGQKTFEISKSGTKAIEDTIEGMNRIKEQVEAIADMVVRLSENSQSIGEIIATVGDLAEQSNILAVNASIEAAKAGEYGRGFAVVAQEMKSLAEQSKQATSQVRTILFDVQKSISSAVMATEQGARAVQEGVDLSAQAGDSIEVLARSVSEATDASIQISVSSQQQLVGMDQVAMAMNNIKDASSQTAASTRQMEKASQDLHNLGMRLQEIIKGYKI